MNSVVGYAFEFLPILLGAITMGLLMSIRIAVKKLIIETRLPEISNLESASKMATHDQKFNRPDPMRYTEFVAMITRSEIFKEDAFALLSDTRFKVSWRGFVSSGEDVEKSAFHRMSYEKMVIAGVRSRNKRAPSEDDVFSCIGHIRYRNLGMLSEYVSRFKTDRIGILFSENRQFIDTLSTFNPCAGYVLAFALNLQLDAYGIGNELHY